MKDYTTVFDSCIYTFESKNNIMDEKDLGICSNIASVLTPERSVTLLQGMQGCPYTATSFFSDVIIAGERVRAHTWRWLPNVMLRFGKGRDIEIESLSVVVPDTRTIVQKISVRNLTDKDINAPVALMYRGGIRKQEEWIFPIPVKEDCTRDDFKEEDGILTYEKNGAAFHWTCSLENMKIFPRAYMWETKTLIPANETTVFYFSIHFGEAKQSKKEALEAKGQYEALLDSSFAYLAREVNRIEERLPRLSADVPELVKLYNQSLVTYILCRWENPDLYTSPYYSTGSINGSCMCSYLWDYCGGLMMHPIYDPEGNKKQLRGYLKNDLTTSFALNPFTSGPTGPWYQVNQEKIICMVYHHIAATGEVEFLHEQVGERTVLEWMRYHAYVCDDVSKEVELYDYGIGGNAHLEMAYYNNGPYNGIMPDLNARRYMNYMRAYTLTKLAGKPDEMLRERAQALKEKLKALWNEDKKWYDFIDADGNRDIRYTVQMFKFIASGVIDEHEREGLISHLNETEFLSEYGLHSMSKLDTQYDQDDIDNGGGGICTHFAMQICAQLYEMGYDSIATDILKRVYWWGERLPYLGDSCASNLMANRESTPLQGDISSVSCAQMIFFYIFGIRAGFDGKVSISPVKNRPAENMKIENARLCGKLFAVEITGDSFTVTINGKEQTANIGETVVI